MRFQYAITVTIASGAIASLMTPATGNLVRRGGGGPNLKAQEAMAFAAYDACWETCLQEDGIDANDENGLFDVPESVLTKCNPLDSRLHLWESSWVW
ncbi:hypothetical protein PspLS_11798 [Pyricularia sp. CBS 133598]|nr:hypothetical protein PspLS_11798 [Pyricularia sp. CBS 133598]